MRRRLALTLIVSLALAIALALPLATIAWSEDREIVRTPRPLPKATAQIRRYLPSVAYPLP